MLRHTCHCFGTFESLGNDKCLLNTLCIKLSYPCDLILAVDTYSIYSGACLHCVRIFLFFSLARPYNLLMYLLSFVYSCYLFSALRPESKNWCSYWLFFCVPCPCLSINWASFFLVPCNGICTMKFYVSFVIYLICCACQFSHWLVIPAISFCLMARWFNLEYFW
jgi:hypothetical protein